MSNPQHQDPHATSYENAIEHASRLAEPRPTTFTPEWSAQAAHVGDMSVLLLALRG
jgi:hypothetical protein